MHTTPRTVPVPLRERQAQRGAHALTDNHHPVDARGELQVGVFHHCKPVAPMRREHVVHVGAVTGKPGQFNVESGESQRIGESANRCRAPRETMNDDGTSARACGMRPGFTTKDHVRETHAGRSTIKWA